MTRHTIKYIGFNPKQQEAISAILDLADSSLTCTWLITDATDSDVLMINLDADNGQQIFTEQLQIHPAYRIVMVAEHSEIETDKHWFLSKKPYGPPSLKELIKLLNDIAEILTEKAAIAETIQAPEATEATEATTIAEVILTNTSPEESAGNSTVAEKQRGMDSDAANPTAPKSAAPLTRPLHAKNYFFGTLLQAKKDNDCRAIKLNKLPTLYLSPTENNYHFSGSPAELQIYYTATPQYLREAIITKLKLAKILKSGQTANAQPLDALIAEAIIEVSQGRLLEGHSAEQTVRLTQIPDTSKIPALTAYSAITDVISQQPCNLFQLAELLQTPLSSIFEFYNVLYLLGYLTPDTTTATETLTITKPKTTKQLGFLKDFFKKNIF